MIYTTTTHFGRTATIPLVTYTNGDLDNPPREDWKHDLWVESSDDYYALMYYAREHPGEAVRVVTRRAFLQGTGETHLLHYSDAFL